MIFKESSKLILLSTKVFSEKINSFQFRYNPCPDLFYSYANKDPYDLVKLMIVANVNKKSLN